MHQDNETRAAPPSVDSLARALEEYLAAAEVGVAPPREEFLARYPQLADDLDACLAALRFIGRAAEGPRSVVAEAEAARLPEPSLGQLGDFRLIRELGRGGMGVVYEAEQLSLGRRVALKVLPFAATLDPRQLQRFKNEARAAASLHHPHIVPIHAVGEERAVHFYAMQFIEGQTLAALIADLRRPGGRALSPEDQPTAPHLPEAPAADTAELAAASTEERGAPDPLHFRRVAEWGAQAAEALEHAHQQGIVHRDVKPANLMLDGRGNLWVTDFGLAHVQSDSRLTMTGDLVGTLRYMSPEQALAKRAPLDHRTDVYSLGATLYELLTLTPALGGGDRQELLRRIAFEEPRAPRRLNRAIPSELETVVLKALEKNPADRYATAKELADDLRRWLADEPIRARPPGAVRRLRRWVRRRPVLTTAAVLLLAFAAVLLAYPWRPPTQADVERRAEEEYRKAMAPLERDLARGRPVSLVGPTTRALPYHRWRAGRGLVELHDNPQADGILSVSAPTPSLLELLRDPGCPAYRLVVELRQDSLVGGTPSSQVAAAFACREAVTKEGPQFLFARVGFADLGNLATAFGNKRKPVSRLQLDFFHLGTSSLYGYDRQDAYGGPCLFYEPWLTQREPGSTRIKPGPWRRLEIEVRPGRFRVKHWDGRRMELVPEGEWSRAVAAFQKRYPDLRGVEPGLVTRCPVGLYLEDNVVSLRRFDVEPLGEGE